MWEHGCSARSRTVPWVVAALVIAAGGAARATDALVGEPGERIEVIGGSTVTLKLSRPAARVAVGNTDLALGMLVGRTALRITGRRLLSTTARANAVARRVSPSGTDGGGWRSTDWRCDRDPRGRPRTICRSPCPWRPFRRSRRATPGRAAPVVCPLPPPEIGRPRRPAIGPQRRPAPRSSTRRGRAIIDRGPSSRPSSDREASRRRTGKAFLGSIEQPAVRARCRGVLVPG